MLVYFLFSLPEESKDQDGFIALEAQGLGHEERFSPATSQGETERIINLYNIFRVNIG